MRMMPLVAGLFPQKSHEFKLFCRKEIYKDRVFYASSPFCMTIRIYSMYVHIVITLYVFAYFWYTVFDLLAKRNYSPIAANHIEYMFKFYLFILLGVNIVTTISICLDRCILLCGVATISRLLKIMGLVCKRDLYKGLYSAKETYNFKAPTHHSHPITICIYAYCWKICILFGVHVYLHAFMCL